MLILEIESYQKTNTQQPVRKQLEEGKLRIGRDISNEWSLIDPARVLSKQHCLIEYNGQDYILTDTSTNGVFINSSTDALGRDNSLTLKSGDTIRISDYEINVRVESKSVEHLVAPAAPAPVVEQRTAVSPPPPPPPVSVIDDNRDWKSILEDEPKPEVSIPEPSGAIDVPELAQGHYDAPSVGMSIPEDWGTSSPAQNDIQPLVEKTEDPIPEQISSTNEAAEAAVNQPQPQPQPMPVQTPQTAPAQAVPADQQALITAFLKGAGINPETKLPADAEQTMREIGGLFRQVTMGLMGVLAARGDIKSEFRLSQTMIRPTANNPLKFSLNIDEAMVALLSKRGQGYMQADEAFEEAFEDIKAHQLAVLTGMQSAMKNLLKRLEPQKIQDQGEDRRGVKKLLGGQKSKFWDEYVVLYKTLFQQSEDDFQTIFGHEFAKAYEQQILNQKNH